jgi:transcriptional regulator with XRE-family HTH domain
MNIDDKLLGKAIARFRELRGLTQAQLNQRTGMSTIQHIEQGRNTVSMTALNKIAAALDVPAACLTLLGSPVEKKDKVLSSLRGLLEATMKLPVETASPARKSRTGAKRKATKKSRAAVRA